MKMITECVHELSDHGPKLFPTLESGNCSKSNDPGFEDSHIMQIIKEVSRRYLTLRLQTYAKFYNRVIVHKSEASIRHKMTKIVIFKNQ